MIDEEDNESSESPPAENRAARFRAAGYAVQLSGSKKLSAVAARQVAQKEMRRQAYQKAKERRAKDPRYLQMKEAAKARRREHYERVKQHRKAAQAAGKAERSAQRASVETEARAFFQKGRAPKARLAIGAGAPEQGRHFAEAASLLPVEGVVANDVS